MNDIVAARDDLPLPAYGQRENTLARIVTGWLPCYVPDRRKERLLEPSRPA